MLLSSRDWRKVSALSTALAWITITSYFPDEVRSSTSSISRLVAFFQSEFFQKPQSHHDD